MNSTFYPTPESANPLEPQAYSNGEDQRSLKPPEIHTVFGLLSLTGLTIPDYQRPYKWSLRNVGQLFDDLATFEKKKAYRLGTIVFHHEKNERHIVDGQQRTITLLLTLKALFRKKREAIQDENLKAQIGQLHAAMPQMKFRHPESVANIHANYREIERIISRDEFSEERIDFLLNRCEVVTFLLTDLSEAFQFFDSQNARGRDLDPHDLLKAFHLREFHPDEVSRRAAAVADWEKCETAELQELFARYLFRIRNWSRGVSARHFGKEDIGLFKGINPDRDLHRPFAGQLRISHHFIDHYNSHYERRITGDSMAFPFRVDQPVINGRRFFEMISHYRSRIAEVVKIALGGEVSEKFNLSALAGEIIQTLDHYPGHHRDGDRYVRETFNCLLAYYIDKFGNERISEAIEKIFIWAYSLRLSRYAVQLSSVDNHALQTALFQRLRDAVEPSEFLQIPLSPLGAIASNRPDDLLNLFTRMRYHG